MLALPLQCINMTFRWIFRVLPFHLQKKAKLAAVPLVFGSDAIHYKSACQDAYIEIPYVAYTVRSIIC
jgi:hypothetical protein